MTTRRGIGAVVPILFLSTVSSFSVHPPLRRPAFSINRKACTSSHLSWKKCEESLSRRYSTASPERDAENDNRNLMNSVAFINAMVIGFFVLGGAYEILHVDVEAALALFRFDDSMEASALATTIDLFLRLPTDSIHSYEELVPSNPVFYKACTSGVAYTIGDFVSQVYQGRTLGTLDLKRSARSGAAGFLGHGPLCHFWMLFMETYLDFGGAWWATGIKVIADQVRQSWKPMYFRVSYFPVPSHIFLFHRHSQDRLEHLFERGLLFHYRFACIAPACRSLARREGDILAGIAHQLEVLALRSHHFL